MARALDDAKVRFSEQVWIGPYCVDFLLPTLGAVVEVDGDYWHKSRRDKDARKDNYLRACGFHVWRWAEMAVRANANACVETMTRNWP